MRLFKPFQGSTSSASHVLALLSVVFTCLLSSNAFAGWTNFNTGINDRLTGVVFNGTSGVLSGHKGLYYTNNGGNGASSWQRYNIAGNAADSLIYNRTRFNHCFAQTTTSMTEVYACGEDTVTHQAIIFRLNLTNMGYNIRFTGTPGSALNRINYRASNSSYYAVGENGLIVNFTSAVATQVAVSLTDDFNSIAFDGNNFWIGTYGKIIRGSAALNVFTFTVLATPLDHYADVVYPATGAAYGVGNKFFRYFGGISFTENYNYGPLNGNCIFPASGGYFVGTDHGIFKSSTAATFLEWQSTSMQHDIQCFYKDGTDFYACGADGVLLGTADVGGPPTPFVKLNVQGNCLGGTTNVTGNTGSATNCFWTIDNQYAFSGCTSHNYTFSTPGPHTVSVSVYSSGISMSDTQTFYVVTQPLINKPVLISDDLLCHQEPIDLTVEMSEQSVFYVLKRFGSQQNFGNSFPGNGGNLTFSSFPLSEAGNYYLRAESSLANCGRNFTDTIVIDVEKTKAVYHAGTLNAEIGETVNFFENSVDAQSFEWTFGPDASVPASTLADPQTAFGTAGSTTVKLVASSINGCQDSIQSSGPVIYAPAPVDSCWTITNTGIDIGTLSVGDQLTKISPSVTGFLTSGYYNAEQFGSNQGSNVQLPHLKGGFAAKYDFDGTLKWMVHTGMLYSNTGDEIDFVVEDKEGNVYISGTADHFFDNAGDSIFNKREFSSFDSNGDSIFAYAQCFIAKLDPEGRLLWKLNSRRFLATRMAVDASNQLLVYGRLSGGDALIKRNNVFLDSLATPSGVASWNYGFMKFTPDGYVTWKTGARMDVGEVMAMHTDKDNNIYATGYYDYSVDFYAPGSTVAHNYTWNMLYGSRLFLVKYDSTGAIQWTVQSTSDNGISEGTRAYGMATDSLGNCYISGKNHCSYHVNPPAQIFHNADGSITSMHSGSYFVAKVSNAGICQWIQGQKYALYGYGYDITQRGNEVAVLGKSGENGSSTNHSLFGSADSTQFIDLTISRGDCFIAIYDTTGKLLRMHLSGDNEAQVEDAPQLINGPDNSFYVARVLDLPAGSTNFRTTVQATNGDDGFITRVQPGCVPVLYPQTNASYVTACETYTLFGETYTSSGSYVRTVEDLYGNDSTFVLELTVNQPTESIFYDTACTFYQMNGYTYDTSGVYTQVLQNVAGCDSTIQLVLTLEIPSSEVYATACGNYFLNGNSYNATGIYEQVLQTTDGCDSIVVLHLTTYNPMSELFETACDSYDLNGTTYTSTGTYEQFAMTPGGCDSTITLHLTVHANTSSEVSISAMDSYTLNGVTYTQSGTYTQFLPNAANCDSMITLHLMLDYTGLDELGSDAVTVFPNPMQDELTIQRTGNGNALISLFDPQGKVVVNPFSSAETTVTVNTAGLTPGIYFLQIDSGSGQTVTKVVKD